MVDQAVGIARVEPAVPNTVGPISIDDRVRPIEARAQTRTSGYPRRDPACE